jgi:hypothetical protein
MSLSGRAPEDASLRDAPLAQPDHAQSHKIKPRFASPMRAVNTDDPAIRMKPQPESSTEEVLAGLVERVTFHNAENGFCVLRAKARGHRELVTVVGHAAIISAGEWITATGEWVNDRTHGQQFKARFLRTSAPTSADGIEKYLSSTAWRGSLRGRRVFLKRWMRGGGCGLPTYRRQEPSASSPPTI